MKTLILVLFALSITTGAFASEHTGVPSKTEKTLCSEGRKVVEKVKQEEAIKAASDESTQKEI